MASGAGKAPEAGASGARGAGSGTGNSPGGRLPAAPPLPARDGVGASRVYLPDGPWRTLGEFLPGRFPFIDPEVLMARLARGDIVDASGVPQHAGSPYIARTWLWYYREAEAETPVPFDMPVLYRDARLVVVDKPHFLASVPGGRHVHETALTRLRRDLDAPHITPLHRLDRDTAGILVFCLDPRARGAYQSLFQARVVDKEYEALAPARGVSGEAIVCRSRLEPEPGRIIMRQVDGEPNSETEITLMEVIADAGRLRRAGDADGPDASGRPDGANLPAGSGPIGRYRLRPVTGRKHQLRAQMSALGCPIINDPLYGVAASGLSSGEGEFSQPLQLLARAIAFTDPYTGERRRFESQRTLLL